MAFKKDLKRLIQLHPLLVLIVRNSSIPMRKKILRNNLIRINLTMIKIYRIFLILKKILISSRLFLKQEQPI